MILTRARIVLDLGLQTLDVPSDNYGLALTRMPYSRSWGRLGSRGRPDWHSLPPFLRSEWHADIDRLVPST